MRRKYLLLFFIICRNLLPAQVQPIQHGHAHNDYLHKRPLFEALDNGFTSIEIDVYLRKNELKVSHWPFGLNKKENIQELYLDPIRKVIAQNGGTVYKASKTPVIFMIDFKTGGKKTYLKLKEILEQYKDILAVYRYDSVIHAGPIQILITGKKPLTSVMKEDTGFTTIDNHINMLGHVECNKVTTRYSDPWKKHFSWHGKGHMPAAQQEKLKQLVAQVHAKGKQIRFYHIPDKPEVWKLLLDAHVDWINTDKLEEFSRFCK